MTEKAYAAVVLFAIAVGVVLHFPSLDAGLAADDYLQRAMLDESYPVSRSALDLYSFVDGHAELARLMEAGTLPWWSDPALELRALRPLSSLAIALEERVLGLSARAQHVHSLLWFALLIAAFSAICRKLVRPWPAALAVVLLAVDPAHVLPIGWLANRTALLSAGFGALAFFSHLRWRMDGWRPGAPLAGLGFSLAFAAGEYALSFVAYVVSFELICGRGSVARRIARASTALVPCALYLAAHVALGYGARGSAVYVDPIARPLAFVIAALVRVPVLALSELAGVPPEALHGGAAMLGIWGWLVLVVLFALACWLSSRAIRGCPPPERRNIAALAVGALGALIPLAGTLPSARLLVVPSLGGSLVLALVIGAPLARLRSLEPRPKLAPTLAGAAVALIFVLAHLVIAPAGTLLAAMGWRDLHVRSRQAYLEAPIAGADTVVLLNAVEPMSLISPPYVRRAHGQSFAGRWRALSITHRPAKIQRTGRDTLELSVEGGGMFEDPSSQLFRALEHPLTPGQTIALSDVTVEVLELSSWGPKRVRYRFAAPLDDPSLVVVVLRGGRLQRLPALAIGEQRSIPPG